MRHPLLESPITNSDPATGEKSDDATQRDLSADIHFLGDLLGGTIRRLAGEEAFALVEEVRAAAKTLRARHSVAEARKLRDRLGTLDLPALRTLIRSFSLYFDLVNLAEQCARLRALHQRALAPVAKVSEDIEAAFSQLREQGVSAAQVLGLLEQGLIVPVFTAHPSESRRRTLREKLAAICRQLDLMEYTQLAPRERETALAEIAEEIETFWFTDLVRGERPSVLDEVAQGLGVVGDDAVRGCPTALPADGDGLATGLSGTRFFARPFLSSVRRLDRRRPRRQPVGDARRHGGGRPFAAGNDPTPLPRRRR